MNEARTVVSQVVVGTLVLLALVSCCSSKGLVPVEGRVTFNGREPQVMGYLFFVPREMTSDKLENSTGPLSGTTMFGPDGFFRGTTFKDGDGLRPGTYEVRLACEGSPAGNLSPEEAHSAPAQSRVPKGFKPPDLVVPASGARPVRYDLDVTVD